jgi:2-keto-4-pentenoate hydratase/2-oxohepta-3-ene-1,7-dioic acid hydratase in catechol pathway
MKLATFQVDTAVGPVQRVGIDHEGTLLDVTAGYAHVLDGEGEADPGAIAETVAPPSMIEFLQCGDRAFEAARDVRETVPDADAETGPGGAQLTYDPDAEGVRILSPLPRPNSLRDFMAFEEHVQNTMGEVPDVWYEIPVCYKGNADSVVGPETEIQWPNYSDMMDLELEIGAVIGKRGRNIDPAAAEEYIAGYTLFNDFTARDIQGEEMAGRLGPAKGKDFANALGPHLVTPGAFDLETAEFSVEVDGEVWSDGTVGEMGHSFAELVAQASDEETLHPGDVLGSGTVGTGCGLELGTFLDPGATVSISVEGLGTLTNTLSEKP